MAKAGAFLYLSSADIDRLDLKPPEIIDAVEEAFIALARGGARSVPKSGFDVTPSTFFHAMPARYDKKNAIGIKWIGTALNEGHGLPHINAMIVLNDLETAVVRAVMDGTTITAIRPSAVSVVAARRLARKNASRISFYPCGIQARAHLDAFAGEFPIAQVTCLSRRRETAEAFAAYARAKGLEAKIVTEPRDAVRDQDIVVSSAPRAADLAKILDPSWLSPGAFVSGVDLARAWQCRDLRQVELLATDNHQQSREAAATGVISWVGEYDADLSELASGAHPGRTTDTQRAFFVHPGLGLGDIAIASLVQARARALGLGMWLPR
ncbi:MAG: ornithine cyclodeaminase family protein [Alphaproteobacteria bacterium]|nr:ornithine cyclodeaminase family protein [Alphaproteobacteria bacterium]